jgi:hypothetical protein
MQVSSYANIRSSMLRLDVCTYLAQLCCQPQKLSESGAMVAAPAENLKPFCFQKTRHRGSAP